MRVAVYDAIGKFPISGVTGGNAYSIGSYTSCKDVNVSETGGLLHPNRPDLVFGGKYCSLERVQLLERVRKICPGAPLRDKSDH